ncbi:Bug family tripartite tricarboxylate transporter substrate binding protein [Ramlibacter sp.]|uniref:Bug family tripartite tricarboxylate transporter substrate binding protein n=1 Tax=Ramlibacter sp. TaxID=1917967 RepID=UPI003D13B96B
MNFARTARTLALGLFAIAPALAPLAASAQDYPSKPIRFIVPGAPGGSPDVFARVLAEKLQPILKQPVLVESRPGAGGLIGVRTMDTVNDKHGIMMMVTSVAAVLPVINKEANFDVLRDMTPIVNLGYTPMMVVASPSTGVKTLAEAVAWSKKQAVPPVFAHAGPGTMSNLSQERTAKMSGMNYRSVSFGSPAKTLTALVGGDAHFYADAASVMTPMIQGNRVVPLAVLGRDKLYGQENVPIARDSIPGLEAVGAFGIVGPKNLTAAEAGILSRAFLEVLKQPDMVARARDLGIYLEPGDSASYSNTLKQEQQVWGKAAAELNLQTKQ